MSVRMEIRLENGPLASDLSTSLKVTGTDTDRSATYDFPLVIRDNHGPISYRFRNSDFDQKLQFSHPYAFKARSSTGGFPVAGPPLLNER